MVQAEHLGSASLAKAGADTITLSNVSGASLVRGGVDKTSIIYKSSDGKTKTMQLNVLALGNSVGSGPKGVQAPLVTGKYF